MRRVPAKLFLDLALELATSPPTQLPLSLAQIIYWLLFFSFAFVPRSPPCLQPSHRKGKDRGVKAKAKEKKSPESRLGLDYLIYMGAKVKRVLCEAIILCYVTLFLLQGARIIRGVGF